MLQLKSSKKRQSFLTLHFLCEFCVSVPLTCISNIFWVYFVCLVVLFCFGGLLSFFFNPFERFNREIPGTFQVYVHFSLYYRLALVSYGHCLCKGSQAFIWEVIELLWNLLTVSSFGRFEGINCVHSFVPNSSYISLLQKASAIPQLCLITKGSILFRLFFYPNSFQLS